jgi:hypothetical protein
VLVVGSIDFGWSVTGSADGASVADGLRARSTRRTPAFSASSENAFEAMTRPRAG